jgi:UDP-GlcNAc:undecaprenyl-phosphate GlcNAc-1-phosphate transferase
LKLELLLPFAVAAVVAAIGVLVMAGIARRAGVVARVRADRWHTSGEIPRLCGPALFAAMAPFLPAGHVLVLGYVCAIGVIDDVRSFSPAQKALALLAGAVLAGIVTGSLWVPVALWVACNAVNMLDHADGLAATTVGVAMLGIGGEAGLSAAGACLGFLVFNYPPARVFMGDGGSLTLGAAIVLASAAAGPAITVGWLAVPLIDAAFVTARRLSEGRKPWIGGTDHLGHALLGAGLHPRLLPLLYGGAALVIGLSVQTLAG